MKATFKDILKGGLIALIAAFILRWLLPIPVLTTVAILMALLVIQILNEKFGGGLKIATDWAKYGLSAGAALLLYLLLRTVVGKMLGIYPNDSWAGYDRAEGVIGFFWQKNADDITLVWEIIFAVVATGLSWGLVYKKKFKGLIFGFLVFALLWATLYKKFAPEMTAREAAIHNTVAAIIDPNSGSGGTPSNTPTSTTQSSTPQPEPPEFPHSGNGHATKKTPIKAWLDPHRTYTSSSDRSAKYVNADNPAISFNDLPGYNVNHAIWKGMPAGKYLVYALSSDEIQFSWHQ